MTDSDTLTSLEGLGITSVGTHLYVRENDGLESLDGLEAMTSVGGNSTVW